jgi:hypothetical protein
MPIQAVKDRWSITGWSNDSPKLIPKSKVPKMMVRKIFGLLGIYTRFGNFWGTFEDFEKMTEMSLI